jgi:[NiFe] hydrogenase assembly HybE family chaperone
MNGFEGSFLGDGSRIAPATVLECGVCWWVYDPTLGDETWQIPPGTAFTDLPDHWRCPGCDNPPEQFMVLKDDGPAHPALEHPAHDVGLALLQQKHDQLLAAYGETAERMRSLPVYNQRLDIQVVGLRRWDEGLLAIVATPWCMNIVLLPGEDAPRRMEGTTRELVFPSGRYDFIAGQLPGVGALESCSLFSPMEEFDDPGVMRAVAEHAMTGLFTPPETTPDAPGMNRRSFLRGGRRASDRATG